MKSRQVMIGLLPAVLAISLMSCATGPHVGQIGVVAVSETPAPTWMNTVPSPSQGFVYFVGRSSGAASEALAIGQARQDVIAQVQQYIGGELKTNLQNRLLSMNLVSAGLDPTSIGNDFTNYVSDNVVSEIRTQATYWQERTTPGGYEFFGYVLMPFPVNRSMASYAGQQAALAQQRVREAQNEAAKKQAQQVLDFWLKAEKKLGTK